MKATKIIYQKVFNLHNYQNEKIGIEVELEEGEKAVDAYKKAKLFVDRMHKDGSATSQAEFENAQKMIDNPDDYTGRQIKYAQKVIQEITEPMDDLPF